MSSSKIDLSPLNNSFGLLFSEPRHIDFLDLKFDFEISPDHFIEWLKKEGEDIIGDYKTDVSSMCEYSCLYIAMMLSDCKLAGDMKIYYGKFGFWEHYWIGYLYNGEEYFIDLTLQQFNPGAPKLAISKAYNRRESGSYSSLSDGEPIKDYLDRQMAFMFYTNPKTMEQPPCKIEW
jgi:hypothetical protein